MKVKSRRKIWSIPIAALALVLMLAGALVVSGIVQAQTAPSQVYGLVNGDIAIADITVFATYTLEDIETDAALVPEHDGREAVPTDTPPVTAIPAFVNPAIIGGPTVEDENDDDETIRVPAFEAEVGANDDGDRLVTVTLTQPAIEAIEANTFTLGNSYSFRVQLIFDEDPTMSDVDNPVLGGGTPPASAINNDPDLTLTTGVTINILRVKDDDQAFDIVQSKAVKGAVVSRIRKPIDGGPAEWEITGLGPKTTLVSVADLTGAVADFEIKETPAGSGKFRLYVEESGVASLGTSLTPSDEQPNPTLSPISAVLTFDKNPAVDSGEITTTGAAGNADMTITITGDVGARAALAFTETSGATTDDGDAANEDGYHYTFTIPSNTRATTPIGYFTTAGQIVADSEDNVDHDDDDATPPITVNYAAEYLDGIISGSNRSLFDVRDRDMTLVYSGNGSLAVGTYDLDLTVSGDGGMANRTIIGKVLVTVTASNEAPSAPGTFSAIVPEDDPEKGTLMEAGAEVGDASVGVDSGDGDTLSYSLSGEDASQFAVDSDGMVTVKAKILDTEDDDAESTDDLAKYKRPTSDGGKLADVTDKYSKITYEFNIVVSDGVSANNQSIEATVVIVPNRPTTPVTAETALPSGVTYDAEHKVHVDDDDGLDYSFCQ